MTMEARSHLRFWLYWLMVAGTAASGWAAWQVDDHNAGLFKIGGYFGVALCGFGAWLFWPGFRTPRLRMFVVLISAVLVRLAFWGMPVSDDVNRYLWEGRLVSEGVSPYKAVAQDEHYTEYRDRYWELMNHRDRMTAYPPLSIGLFALLVSVDYDVWIMKAGFIVLDLLALAGVLALLYHYRKPLRMSLLYALNPVVLFSFAGEAHYDSAFVACVVWSVYAFVRRHEGWAWALLAAAVQLKWIAVIAMPWLWVNGKKPAALWALPVLLFPFLLIGNDVLNLFEGLYSFGIKSAFNAPLHGLIWGLTGSMEVASWVCYLVFGLWVLAVMRYVKHPIQAMLGLWLGFICCASVVHYWYLTWLAPFMVFSPMLSWLWLSLSSGLYFITTYRVDNGSEWSLPFWVSLVQWVPFTILLLWEGRHIIARSMNRKRFFNVSSCCIVIPTYNDAPALRNCLRQIGKQRVLPQEVIVVDGGSTDNPECELLSYSAARLIQANPSRGGQIAAGVKEAVSEVVMVVHSDAIISENSVGAVLEYLNLNPETPGGLLGVRFSGGGLKMLFIECLNDMRGYFGGAAFGDQVQFFRKEALARVGGYPEIPLMEDVELSLRLMKLGSLAYLDEPAMVSARRWSRSGFLKRVTLVMRCLILYRLNRWRGRDVSRKLYREYYG